MPTDSKNIKTYSGYLWIFIVINFSLYLCVVSNKSISVSTFNDTYKELIIKNGVIAAVSSLLTFILNGVLPSGFKAALVFWRVKHIYPGCRIFTSLMNNDLRIDKDSLIRSYGELPVDPIAQNKLWYKIFKSNQFDPMIFESHKSFLLSRDLTGLAFLFFVCYSAAALIDKFVFSNDTRLLYLYIIYLLAQYVLLSIVSRHFGNRFACNVLAKVSAEQKL
jgi:hypothetical protein